MSSKRIFLGRIGQPKGLKGDFYLLDRRSLWTSPLSTVYLGEHQTLDKVTSNLLYKDRNLIRLESLSSRTAVEKRYGESIWLAPEPASEGGELEAESSDEATFIADELLEEQFIGRRVLDKDGVFLGTVNALNHYGASPVLEICRDSKPTGLLNPTPVLVGSEAVDSDKKWLLEVPLVPAYFDMSLILTEKPLQLCVPAETFADCWA
ncbi:MAG: hypothetical protein KA436_11865 [Oligoflexales bacterium]|nr:hypothetical protein [Oligoflexales bacterium]